MTQQSIKQIIKSRGFRIILFLGISMLWQCKSSKPALAGINGHYVNTNRYQLIDIIKFRKIAVRSELELHIDSTFYLETCAVKEYGKWKTDGKRVFLVCDTMFYKIDSFNYKPEYVKYLKQKQMIDTFYIRRNKLIRYFKKQRMIERLKKVE